MSEDHTELAPVVPLRSDDEELVALESAVLDDLEERDAETGPVAPAGNDPPPPTVCLHPAPEEAPPRS